MKVTSDLLKNQRGEVRGPPKLEKNDFFQGTCIKNFKFLPSQEVLHLLTVFDASLKEAKRMVPDFLLDPRCTQLKFSHCVNRFNVLKYFILHQKLMHNPS